MRKVVEKELRERFSLDFLKGCDMMRNRLLGVDEVMKILNVKKGRAYEIIRELNKELEKNGYRFIRGRINEKYLIERFNLEL